MTVFIATLLRDVAMAPALKDSGDVQASGMLAHRFWQRGGGYDRNLRSAGDIHEKLRYIHNNPVRRGLVTPPLDWPCSSVTAWATGGNEPLPIDRGSFPPLTLWDDRIDSTLMRD